MTAFINITFLVLFCWYLSLPRFTPNLMVYINTSRYDSSLFGPDIHFIVYAIDAKALYCFGHAKPHDCKTTQIGHLKTVNLKISAPRYHNVIAVASATGNFFTTNGVKEWQGIMVFLLAFAISAGYWLFDRNKIIKRELLIKKAEIEIADIYIGELLKNNALLSLKKEILLKKVHHRVKNNLQVIKSMLSAQAAYLNDPAAKTAIDESQLLLETLFLIHKKLYGTEDICKIDMSVFLYELISFISESYLEDGFVFVAILETPKLKLDATQAILVGLLVNEVIVFAVKNEFREARLAEFKIKLSSCDKNDLCLIINYDSGIGNPKSDPLSGARAYLRIIFKLFRQLDAEPLVDHQNGTSISITLKPQKEFFTLNR